MRDIWGSKSSLHDSSTSLVRVYDWCLPFVLCGMCFFTMGSMGYKGCDMVGCEGMKYVFSLMKGMKCEV